ncbi:MAG: hypothetical protein AAB019_01885 [Planctomycetota bacterium]
MKVRLVALFLAGFFFISLNLLTAPSSEPPQTTLNNLTPLKQDYRQLKGVIHLQTPVSGGTRTINDYIQLARQSQIDVLVITDHDTQKYEYSLWPLRWLTNYVVEEKSVFKFGVSRYLKQIETAAKQNQDIVIIDGMESAPFYYWSGSPFQNNLTLNNRGQHLLVIGLKQADAYQKLPVISNGYSNYDQYHGDQSTRPYQDLIDYVTARNGLVFWAHPEAKESMKMNGVNINTIPYPTVLRQTFNYTGFAIFEEGYQKVGQIGGVWDEVLKEYCQGKRKSPVWAMGELDDYGKKILNSVLTVFLVNPAKLVPPQAGDGVKEKNYAATAVRWTPKSHTDSFGESRPNRDASVLEALKTGRMYVVTNYKNKALMQLEDFSVSASSADKNEIFAISGEEIGCPGKPLLHIKISHRNVSGQPEKYPITVKIIRNGRLIKEFNETTPFETDFQDNYFEEKEKFYYRLDVTDELNNKLITNPIFVRFVR